MPLVTHFADEETDEKLALNPIVLLVGDRLPRCHASIFASL
jgi:hypothetical protein